MLYERQSEGKQKVKTMKIESKIIDKWELLKSRGDRAKLAKIGKVSLPTIDEAFNGNCSDELFVVIGSYYNDKMAKIKKYA